LPPLAFFPSAAKERLQEVSLPSYACPGQPSLTDNCAPSAVRHLPPPSYTEFITISREIATLETSLVELQTLLHDWKSVPESLSGLSSLADDASQRKSSSSSTTGGPAARDGGGNGSRRSSVADLQSLYRTQLQALYSQVAGSQKFIPMIPGRHVVAETGAFVELNPATYKAKGGVHLFLLDDLVLIAGVKRRPGGDDKKDGSRGGDDGRLVAEKCWQLAEVTVVDVKDSNGTSLIV
jgi:hypothetical protein